MRTVKGKKVNRQTGVGSAANSRRTSPASPLSRESQAADARDPDARAAGRTWRSFCRRCLETAAAIAEELH